MISFSTLDKNCLLDMMPEGSFFPLLGYRNMETTI